MEKSFIFPSVFEENYREFDKVASTFIEGMKIINFKGNDYIIGELALKEGNSPHKFLNSSAGDTDYQLLGLTALLVATQGRFSNLVITTGFPFTTYQPYRQGAIDFFTGEHELSFDMSTLGGMSIEKAGFKIPHVEVMPEIEGCIKAIRDGEINEKKNFFIASLGFGTFETALSTPNGLIHRTTYSTQGVFYAVNILENILQKQYYLSLLTTQQIERAFQRGSIISNRKRIDLTEIRAKALLSYYKEVISPALRKKFNDEDFLRAEKIYLVGGGARYEELVRAFREEFRDILEIVVFPNPEMAASKGYCLHSLDAGKQKVNNSEEKSNYTYIGLDIGNSNTVVTTDNNF
jgi:hypothetical protein